MAGDIKKKKGNTMETKIVDPRTVDSIITMFFIHLNKRGPTQHSDLLNDFKAFLSFYPDLEERKMSTGETMLKRIEKIRDTPVEFFLKHNKTTEPEIRYFDTGYSLPELDWLGFRDTSFLNPLKKIYTPIFRKKTKYRKQITLAQILKVLSFIKSELYEYIVLYTSEKKVQISYIPEIERTDEEKKKGGFWDA